jgi:hypothetical protein
VRTALIALATAALLALVPTLALGDIPNPSESIPPSSADTSACFTASPSDASCISAALADIDAARADEGVGPMSLPGDFTTLTVPEQLLVVTNLERIDRGLPAFAGLNSSLDSDALVGAQNDADPPEPSPFNGNAYASNLAEGATSALYDDYLWMYDDGLDSPNGSCTPATPDACWGHRDNILYAGDSPLIMGAADDPGTPDGVALTEVLEFGDSIDTADAFAWSSVIGGDALDVSPTSVTLTSGSSAQIAVSAQGENMTVGASITADPTDWSVTPAASCDLTALTAGSTCALTVTDATSTPSQGTLTITGGPSGPQTVTLTRPGAPTASITGVTNGETFTQGQGTTANAACNDGEFGPGIASCTASAPAVSTSTVGPNQTFSVTATSRDGLASTTTVTYNVVAASSSNPGGSNPGGSPTPAPPSPTTTITVTTHPLPAPLTRAQKLAKALKACKKRPKRKRPACEKAAKKRYGPKKAKKPKKKRR